MNAEYSLRPTQKNDLEAIAAIAEATGLFPSDALEGMIAPFLQASGSDLWLTALLGAEEVGFCFCEPERFTNGTWNLRAIGVRPDHQSRGVGAALTTHLKDWLRSRGGRILIVETTNAPEQRRTCAFYSRNY